MPRAPSSVDGRFNVGDNQSNHIATPLRFSSFLFHGHVTLAYYAWSRQAIVSYRSSSRTRSDRLLEFLDNLGRGPGLRPCAPRLLIIFCRMRVKRDNSLAAAIMLRNTHGGRSEPTIALVTLQFGKARLQNTAMCTAAHCSGLCELSEQLSIERTAEMRLHVQACVSDPLHSYSCGISKP